MKRGGLAVVAAGLLIASAALAAVSPVRALKVSHVTLLVRHRVFADFAEMDTVRMKEDFQIGDTPYSARVVEFVPDFFMDVKKHQISSRTNEPKNPAFRIIVREKGVPQDTTWAFLNPMVHFARKSMLSFRVLRIDFPDRAPVLADTSRKAPAAPEAPKP